MATPWFLKSDDQKVASTGGEYVPTASSKSTSSGGGLGLGKQGKKWAKRGAGMLENERGSGMNRLIGRFQRFGELDNIKGQRNIADKIRGLGSSYGDSDLDIDALLNSLYAKEGSEGYYDPGSYAWGPQATTPTPGTGAATDVGIESDLGDLANVPGYEDLSTALPPWLDLGGDKSWKDIAQADVIAQWVEAQRAAAGQDRAANVAAQQMQGAQELGETPVMSDEDVQRMLGGQAGQLADVEQRTMGGIRENMGARGMAPGSGIGGGMAGNAAIRRQMGLAQAGTDLGTQQMMANRSGLERALGMESSAASNLQNILTGFGTQQFNLPAADYWRTMQDPGWATPKQDALGQGMNVLTSGLNAASGVAGLF